MLLALDAGLTGEDYVFFHLDVFGRSLQDTQGSIPQKPWERGDMQDSKAQQAFRVSAKAEGTAGLSPFRRVPVPFTCLGTS